MNGRKIGQEMGRPMRSLGKSGRIHVDKMIGIYTGKRVYHFDGIDVLPVCVPIRLSIKNSFSILKVSRYPWVTRISNISVPLNFFILREGCLGFSTRFRSCLSALI